MSEIIVAKKENKISKALKALSKIALILFFVIAHFMIFNFYLTSYNEVNNKLTESTQQLAKCEKEKSELKSKLEDSFLKRNIVTPVANAISAVSNFFTSEEKKHVDESITGKIKGMYEEITKATL